MGKSDPYVYSFYLKLLSHVKREVNSIGFFGQPRDNNLSYSLNATEKKFFDLALDNWDINELPYEVSEKFDLIVCTRCAYFSKNPQKTVEALMSFLNEGGYLLIDWGLGDHWRFEKYKVGWKNSEEQEWAYAENNYLWSAAWHDSFEDHPEVEKFKKRIEKFGYSGSLSSIIQKEVDFVLDPTVIKCNKMLCDHLSLWEDKPQLYTCFLIEK
jgi:SAM-dependent methyltransferase